MVRRRVAKGIMTFDDIQPGDYVVIRIARPRQSDQLSRCRVLHECVRGWIVESVNVGWRAVATRKNVVKVTRAQQS